MKRRMIFAVSVLALLLAACSSSGGSAEVIHVERGASETQAAQTAWALEHPTPTPGPSPSPTITSTPYTIPTRAPELDGDTVITRVGTEEITLDEFQQRVRFERWATLYRIARLAEKYGPEQVLDLRLAENAYVTSLFATLADSNSFGIQVHRVMIVEEIALQEARRRDLDVDPFQYDAKRAEYLGLQVGENGQLPPAFDDLYAGFLDEMAIYSGMTEEDFQRLVRAKVLYDQEEFLFGQSPEAQPSTEEAVVGVVVEDILVDTGVQAGQVIERLEAGEAMIDIATSLGKTPTSGETSRVVRRTDATLPDDVLAALFTANPGEIVGPYATTAGWYVALIKDTVMDMLSPEDIQEFRKQYFLSWVEAQMDDTAFVEDHDNWFDAIPQDPLPQDVSPLLRDEYIILPEDTTEAPLFGSLDGTTEAAPESGE